MKPQFMTVAFFIVLALLPASHLEGTDYSALLGWGGNDDGQLGVGQHVNIFAQPTRVMTTRVVAAIAGGKTHTLFLMNDGKVRASGWNHNCQLGDEWALGDYIYYETMEIDNFSEVIAISAGGYSSYALKQDGTVWAWGDNDYGQSGSGNVGGNICTPVQVINLTGVTAISAGDYFCLALRTDGSVWAWGYNAQGVFGPGATIGYSASPIQVPNLPAVKAIAAGAECAYALRTDGSVWSWGGNISGQLGNGTTVSSNVPSQIANLTGILAIEGGRRHALALKEDGSVWGWGGNYAGQLGDGTNEDRYSPIKVINLSGIVEIAAGFEHSLALKDDGTVWVWGSGSQGQLGNGAFEDSNVPDNGTTITRGLAIASCSNASFTFVASGGHRHTLSHP